MKDIRKLRVLALSMIQELQVMVHDLVVIESRLVRGEKQQTAPAPKKRVQKITPPRKRRAYRKRKGKESTEPRPDWAHGGMPEDMDHPLNNPGPKTPGAGFEPA